MATQPAVYRLYHRGNPPKIYVWCSDTFSQEVGQMYRRCSPADQAQFANIHVLIDRFAKGEQLSQASFRQERQGYAFKAGALRFYGAFSTAHVGAFVLSHAIVKRHDKLAEADHARLLACRQAFDALAAAPAIPT